MEQKSAVVLAMFGTSVAAALPGLLNIRAQMEEHYPASPVRIAFTSKIIRRLWRERAADSAYRVAQPQVPEEVFCVRGPLATIAGLQASGYNLLVIQPVQMAPAEEYIELCSAVEFLALTKTLQQGLQPLTRLVVGRPALGTSATGEHGSAELAAAAQALAADAELARSQQAALLYMGHGSKGFPVGSLYQRFAEAMRCRYPDVLTVMALVEGAPTVQDALQQLRRHRATKVVLKPFMVVAGDHACKDMVGPAPRGWQSLLASEGFTVVPVLSGLGEQDSFAGIFVRHAATAASAAGIILR